MAVKGSVKFGPLTPRFAFLEHVIAPLSPHSATIFALQRIAVDRIMLREVLALGALMVGMCGLLLGNGLFGTLTALRMSGEGFDPTIIGIVLSCHSLGFIVGCLYGQRIIRRTGHIRCFTAFAALLAVVCLVLPIVVTPATWIPLRLIFGYCSAMVFMVAESWLTGAASSETKGRVFAVYMVINKGSFGAGQLLLLLGDPAGDRLFMLTAILFAICLVPIALASRGAPPDIDAERIGLRALYRHSPVGVMGALAAGFANAPLMGLGPVFGAEVGLGVEGVSYFMAVFLFGSLALQIPIGRLSDRFDRRVVLIGVAVAAAVSCGAMATAVPLGYWPVIALSFVIGGLSAVVYPIAMAHANDHARAETLVSIMAGLLLTFGVGASISPFFASLAMKWLGPAGLYIYAAGVYAWLAAFTVYRRTRRAPAPEQAEFVAQPQTSQSSAVVTTLDPRADDTQ